MKIKIKRSKGNLSILQYIVFCYILIIYPLVNKLFDDQYSNINRIFLVGIFFIYFVANWKFIKKLTTKRINIVLFFSLLYILFSLICYSMNMNFEDVLQEVLYSIVPIFFYFIADTYDYHKKSQVCNLIVKLFLFVIVIGVICIVFPIPYISDIVALGAGGNFQSIYSAISMGYVSQLMYAMLLFNVLEDSLFATYRVPLLIMLFFISLITLQRAAVLGIMTSTGLFIFFLLSNNGEHITKRATITFLCVIIIVLILLLNINELAEIVSSIMEIDIARYIRNVIKGFRIDEVLSDRTSQSVIFNNSNFLNILLGEGYGKYSPNNANAVLVVTDACYQRLYNELGLIGCFSFFAPYILMFLKTIRRKNFFGIYFILQTFIAFYFNRVLWSIPISFAIYFILNWVTTLPRDHSVAAIRKRV